MDIIVADDELLPLEGLTEAVSKAAPDAVVFAFRKGAEALAFAQTHTVDIAFLDIEMRGMDGITLAKRLKALHPTINIVFVTGYMQYAYDALTLYASGYLMKPATREKVLTALENLRHPIASGTGKGLRVQTFGNFEVFADGHPLRFEYAKTKELLAYLIDRNGAMCDNGELIAVLWGDDASKLQKSSYLKRLRADLTNTLQGVGCGDALVKRRGGLGVVPAMLECDYYDWLAGKPPAINAYRGEYMSQYSWGEGTLGRITEELNK